MHLMAFLYKLKHYPFAIPFFSKSHKNSIHTHTQSAFFAFVGIFGTLCATAQTRQFNCCLHHPAPSIALLWNHMCLFRFFNHLICNRHLQSSPHTQLHMRIWRKCQIKHLKNKKNRYPAKLRMFSLKKAKNNKNKNLQNLPSPSAATQSSANSPTDLNPSNKPNLLT